MSESSRQPAPREAGEIERALAAVVLGVMLGLVCLLVFTRAAPATSTSPALLYAPLPFLLWAAVRFGPAATSGSLLLVALL